MSREELIEALSHSYQDVLPLLSYLKVRLKYDTVRWIRTYGTKDDIVFSTRIKTFDRVYDKLTRAAFPLGKSSKVLNIALSKKQVLDDLIGIRFICFDPVNLYTLIHYFMITERVATSHRSFYVSPRANLQDPLFAYLKSNGFKMFQKPDRDYEDINFIMRFAHPIDRYFGSGREQFQSLAQQAQPQLPDEKFNALKALFDQLVKDRPELIGAISRFPIECQIVTATQHIYNKTQRPHYEYVLQAKGGEPALAAAEIKDLADRLEILKLNLLAADKSVFSVNQEFGVQYEPPLQIDPGTPYSLDGRLPLDTLGQNARLREINELLSDLVDPRKVSLRRLVLVGRVLEKIDLLNQAIANRAEKDKDIWVSDLLTIKDFPELSFSEIHFWAYQRIVLLMLSVMLLYVPDDEVRRRIIAALSFANEFDRTASSKFDDTDIVLGRLFERLEAIDNAIDLKLRTSPPKIDGWRDDVLSKGLFSDPIIQWRYSSYMYRRREYRNALQEIKVGLGVHDRLKELKEIGVQVAYSVPEEAMFKRRAVEYELCDEISLLRFSTASVAGVLEMCNVVVARYEGWRAQLEEVVEQTADLTERARCFCFLVLFRLCAVSAGGLSGESVDLVRLEFEGRFADLETAIVSASPNSITERTWWLLAKSIMSEQESRECLEQFQVRSSQMRHHTIDRQRFEAICAELIALWMPQGRMVVDRKEFSVNTLGLLERQIKPITELPALSKSVSENSKALSELSGQLRGELTKTGQIAARDKIGKRIADLVTDAAEHILIDTAVAGLRSILGI